MIHDLAIVLLNDFNCTAMILYYIITLFVQIFYRFQFKMFKLTQFFLYLYYLSQIAICFKSNLNLIPNGYNVDNPCSPGSKWAAVGHKNCDGGGDRNNFGNDFFNIGKNSWTIELCQKDSDGDGLTNGVELGDPLCKWNASSPNLPSRNNNITHPGIPNTLGLNACNNVTATCTTFECTAPNGILVKNYTMSRQFPILRNISNFDQSCQAMKLPSDMAAYDIIGYKPFVKNIHSPYYMILYACENGVNASEASKTCRPTGPPGCNITIAVWTSDSPGRCFPSGNAFSIDKNNLNINFENVILQAHIMDNLHDHGFPQVDSVEDFGITIFYTSATNQIQRVQTLEIFQTYLDIPPGKEVFQVSVTCSQNCTKEISGSVQIIDAVVLMHSYGRKGSITLIKPNGTNIRIYEYFDYKVETPQFLKPQQAIKIEAGDSIKLVCEYNTIETTNKVTTNLGAQGDMCAAYITYTSLQQPRFVSCGQEAQMSYCSRGYAPITGCDLNSFQFYGSYVTSTCMQNCTATCLMYIDLIKTTGCLNDSQVNQWIKTTNSPLYTNLIKCSLNTTNCDLTAGITSVSFMNLYCEKSCSSECLKQVDNFIKSGCNQTDIVEYLSKSNPSLKSYIKLLLPIQQIQKSCIDNKCANECRQVIEAWPSECYTPEGWLFMKNNLSSSLWYFQNCNNYSSGCSNYVETMSTINEMKGNCKENKCSKQCYYNIERIRSYNCFNAGFINNILYNPNSYYSYLSPYFSVCNFSFVDCDVNRTIEVLASMSNNCAQLTCTNNCLDQISGKNSTKCTSQQFKNLTSIFAPDMLFYIDNCTCGQNYLDVEIKNMLDVCSGTQCKPKCFESVNRLQTINCEKNESTQYIKSKNSSLTFYLDKCYLVYPNCSLTNFYRILNEMENTCQNKICSLGCLNATTKKKKVPTATLR